jgi:hypothetical protein
VHPLAEPPICGVVNCGSIGPSHHAGKHCGGYSVVDSRATDARTGGHNLPASSAHMTTSGFTGNGYVPASTENSRSLSEFARTRMSTSHDRAVAQDGLSLRGWRGLRLIRRGNSSWFRPLDGANRTIVRWPAEHVRVRLLVAP